MIDWNCNVSHVELFISRPKSSTGVLYSLLNLELHLAYVQCENFTMIFWQFKNENIRLRFKRVFRAAVLFKSGVIETIICKSQFDTHHTLTDVREWVRAEGEEIKLSKWNLFGTRQVIYSMKRAFMPMPRRPSLLPRAALQHHETANFSILVNFSII